MCRKSARPTPHCRPRFACCWLLLVACCAVCIATNESRCLPLLMYFERLFVFVFAPKNNSLNWQRSKASNLQQKYICICTCAPTSCLLPLSCCKLLPILLQVLFVLWQAGGFWISFHLVFNVFHVFSFEFICWQLQRLPQPISPKQFATNCGTYVKNRVDDGR